MTDDSREEFSSLQIQYDTLSGRLERIFAQLQACYDLSQRVVQDSSYLGQFKVRCEHLSKIYTAYEDVLAETHKIALSIDPTTKADIFLQRMTAFDEVYFKIREVFDKLVPPEGMSRAPCPTAQTSVRLPEIELQIFNGNISQWPIFRSNFQALIHQNTALDSTAKFHYLRSTLRGSALALVSELPLTADNYEIAWNALIDRYENKRVLGTELLNKLLKYPHMKKESEVDLPNFIATFGECISALRGLTLPDLGDFILLQLALQCLPKGFHKAFERAHIELEFPTVKHLLIFAQQQAQISEFVEPQEVCQTKGKNERQRKVFVASTIHQSECPKCRQNHYLSKCPVFTRYSVSQRQQFVKSIQLCFNCLRKGHRVAQCESKSNCRTCNNRHHTLLHVNFNSQLTNEPSRVFPQSTLKNETAPDIRGQTGDHKCTLTAKTTSTVLLGTTLIKIKGKNNQYHKVRAVIDPGAMSSFITAKCAQRIGLRLKRTDSIVTGIADLPMNRVSGNTTCIIKPVKVQKPIITTDALVIPNITNRLPLTHIPSEISKKFKHLNLADPNFNQPNEVDMLLGAEVFPYIYTGKRILGSDSEPSALESIFGWIIVGKYTTSFPSPQVALSVSVQEPVEYLLRKFWEVEDIQIEIPQNLEDKVCTEIYEKQVSKDTTGRYVVPLLFKPNHEILGTSYHFAKSRLFSLERKLTRDSSLKNEYSSFMREYEALGHMTLVEPSQVGKASYYIPHHCVVKEHSTSTKVRVVFDASMKTSSGTSLNDILMPGPKLQQDIINILFRFRLHNVVFTADICKMYRQILVKPSHQMYQHILWRDEPTQSIKEFRLNTVTYGLTCSPYLAIKTLHEIAQDSSSNFPRASQAIVNDFYVDDILTGAATVHEACTLRKDVSTLLAARGFDLRKWSSNSQELLSEIPTEHIETRLDLPDESKFVKILGVQWKSKQDCFSYKIEMTPLIYTKRGVLSTCARLFDPLGWVTPVVLKIKIFLQQLWILGIDWDEELPKLLLSEWRLICTELPKLTKVSIDRQVTLGNPISSYIIGFSDASQSGYGAVVYLRSMDEKGRVKTGLLIAKSKVAPIKTISVPKLELCGAVLLSKLIEKTRKLYETILRLDKIYLFSDSTVTLTWLQTPPCKLKTFVANRVTYVLDRTEPEMWQHISTHDNPADLASRGCLASELTTNDLWWTGPAWLSREPENWPVKKIRGTTEEDNLEMKDTSCIVFLNNVENTSISLVDRYSSYWQLIRIVAWLHRFINNLRKTPSNRCLGTLSIQELDKSEQTVIRIVQATHFKDEIQRVRTGKPLSRPLQKLQPFLDNNQLLRVGGRLNAAPIRECSKHPILLPLNSNFVNLLIDYHHVKYLHTGPRTLQSLIMTKYWIISARQVIRSRLSKCIRCFQGRTFLLGDITPSSFAALFKYQNDWNRRKLRTLRKGHRLRLKNQEPIAIKPQEIEHFLKLLN